MINLKDFPIFRRSTNEIRLVSYVISHDIPIFVGNS